MLNNKRHKRIDQNDYQDSLTPKIGSPKDWISRKSNLDQNMNEHTFLRSNQNQQQQSSEPTISFGRPKNPYLYQSRPQKHYSNIKKVQYNKNNSNKSLSYDSPQQQQQFQNKSSIIGTSRKMMIPLPVSNPQNSDWLSESTKSLQRELMYYISKNRELRQIYEQRGYPSSQYNRSIMGLAGRQTLQNNGLQLGLNAGNNYQLSETKQTQKINTLRNQSSTYQIPQRIRNPPGGKSNLVLA